MSTPYGLSTLENAKTVLGVSGSSQDTLITLLLKAASAQVESHCNRKFGLRSLTEKVQGTGRDYLLLSSWPIASVTSVTIDGAAVTDYETRGSELPDGPWFLYRFYGWRWKPSSIADVTTDPDAQSSDYNITVVYYGGYKLPGVDYTASPYSFTSPVISAATDLPGDVELAALRQTQYLFTIRPGLKGERTPGGYSYEALTPVQSGAGLIDDVQALLAPYVRRY